MAALFLSVLSLLLICTTALNLKVAVITEDGQVSESLIQEAVARRVNSNWRVLQGHTLSYVHVNVSWCSSQQAVRTGELAAGIGHLLCAVCEMLQTVLIVKVCLAPQCARRAACQL